ncbi:unnamed protein product, partial [Owenia fusiformis]
NTLPHTPIPHTTQSPDVHRQCAHPKPLVFRMSSSRNTPARDSIPMVAGSVLCNPCLSSRSCASFNTRAALKALVITMVVNMIIKYINEYIFLIAQPDSPLMT